jgi:hypothetical protein
MLNAFVVLGVALMSVGCVEHHNDGSAVDGAAGGAAGGSAGGAAVDDAGAAGAAQAPDGPALPGGWMSGMPGGAAGSPGMNGMPGSHDPMVVAMGPAGPGSRWMVRPSTGPITRPAR